MIHAGLLKTRAIIPEYMARGLRATLIAIRRYVLAQCRSDW
nr:MAG TPA: hypothetical protein [Caudoviricetes sp.]